MVGSLSRESSGVFVSRSASVMAVVLATLVLLLAEYSAAVVESSAAFVSLLASVLKVVLVSFALVFAEALSSLGENSIFRPFLTAGTLFQHFFLLVLLEDEACLQFRFLPTGSAIHCHPPITGSREFGPPSADRWEVFGFGRAENSVVFEFQPFEDLPCFALLVERVLGPFALFLVL